MQLDPMSTFVAIDFETASARRDSACSVGVAVGCAGRVVLSRTYLIRPPSGQFTFTGLHGLRWEDVRDAPTLAELWPTLRAWFDGAAFVAAHNAPFDRSVLHACCARYRLRPPLVRFACTVQLARSQWGIRPTKLPDVCRRLGIPLRHHDAGADAAACARIVLAAEADGWQLGSAENAGRRPAPWYALHGRSPGYNGRATCSGCPSETCCAPGGGDCSAASRHDRAETEAGPRRLRPVIERARTRAGSRAARNPRARGAH